MVNSYTHVLQPSGINTPKIDKAFREVVSQFHWTVSFFLLLGQFFREINVHILNVSELTHL